MYLSRLAAVLALVASTAASHAADLAAPEVDPQWSIRFLSVQDSIPLGPKTVDEDGDIKRYGIALRAPNGVLVGASADITTPPYVGKPRNGRDTARAEGQLGYEWAALGLDFGTYVHAGYLNGRAMHWMNDLVLRMHKMEGSPNMRVSPWSTQDEKFLAAATGQATGRLMSAPSMFGPIGLDVNTHARLGVDTREIGADMLVSLGSDFPFVPDNNGMPVARPTKKIVPYAGVGVQYVDYDVTTHEIGTKRTRGTASFGVRAPWFTVGVTLYSSPTKGYDKLPNPLYNLGLGVPF